MRVAESRIAALDAVTSTRDHAGRCVRALPVSLSVLKGVGIAAGTAASVVGVCVGLRGRRKSAQKMVSKSSSFAGVLQVLMQIAGPFVLPMLQKYLVKHSAGTQGKTVGF